MRLNFIVDQGNLSAQHVAMVSQNFLICIEMFAMAWVFRSVFPYPKYTKPSTSGGGLPGSPLRERGREDSASRDRAAAPSPKSKPSQLFKNFQDVANVTDVLDDARAVLMPSMDRHSKDH